MPTKKKGTKSGKRPETSAKKAPAVIRGRARPTPPPPHTHVRPIKQPQRPAKKEKDTLYLVAMGASGPYPHQHHARADTKILQYGVGDMIRHPAMVNGTNSQGSKTGKIRQILGEAKLRQTGKDSDRLNP